MDTEKLRILLRVAESGSFTRTAEELGYTQSAVSHAVQAVEQEYFNPITNGLVDYDEAIDEALTKLEEAGIDRFLEEYQKQFSEFYANKTAQE